MLEYEALKEKTLKPFDKKVKELILETHNNGHVVTPITRFMKANRSINPKQQSQERADIGVIRWEGTARPLTHCEGAQSIRILLFTVLPGQPHPFDLRRSSILGWPRPGTSGLRQEL